MTDSKLIEARIGSLEPGALFSAADFTDLSAVENVNNVLSRLARAGKVERVVRGIYAKPSYSEFLGQALAPSADAVAHAIARANNWTICPAGDTALNQLGLDTQVPATATYVSNGPYKRYDYAGHTIEMLHRANRDVTGYSPTTALVIQALKALGKDAVDDRVLRTVAGKLSDEQADAFYEEARTATSWVFEFAKRLKEAKGDA